MRTGAVYPRQTNTCLPIFNCLQAKRATRQRGPLLKLKTQQLRLPARRWKRSVQCSKCRGHAMGALHPRQTEYLFADLLLFTSGEGDKATSPSFASENEAIDGSSASLETLIATRYKQGNCTWEQFTHGKQIPVCRSFVLYERRGRRHNFAHFYNMLCGN